MHLFLIQVIFDVVAKNIKCYLLLYWLHITHSEGKNWDKQEMNYSNYSK